MKINKKIEKELLFRNNIKDITSISLDNDYKIKNHTVDGNFIVSGEYKIHEVSVNKEKFEFKIPFSETLNEDIDVDTVKVEITNFEYDYRKDELLVNIEYDIVGDRNEVLIFDDEESLEEFLKKKEVEVIDTRVEDIKTSILEKDTTIEDNSDKMYKENHKELRKENVDSDTIMNNINKTNDNFITYKVYKIKENDTLESIVLKHKTNIEELSEFNELNNLQINDKLIIPSYE